MKPATIATDDRRAHLERLRARDVDPFPHAFDQRRTVGELLPSSDGLESGQVLSGPGQRVAGRLLSIRDLGRVAFMTIRDRTGTLQLLLDERVLGAEAFACALEHQRGDHVGALGHVARSRRGEPSLLVVEVTLLAKTLVAAADELRDPETRRRHRERDLIANDTTRRLFRGRAAVIREIRRFFDEHGFIEIETPILQPIYGGAEARPFVTRHLALGRDMYLRIAPELFLKRAIAGDLERVFEIGRNFRNEGISSRHNPEFTALEWYEAYADYGVLARELEELVHRAAIAYGHPDPAAFAPPWPRVRLHEAIREQTGIDVLAFPDAPSLRAAAVAGGLVEAGIESSFGAVIDRLQTLYVEPAFSGPTFLVDHPAVSLAARQAPPRGPAPGRALRGLHRRHGDRQRVH